MISITQELMARNRTVDQLQILADRERAVLELMAQGLSIATIAERLILSARSVESHVNSIMTKLDPWEGFGWQPESSNRHPMAA